VRAGEPASRRTDVYGIGCVLYELVTGRAPSLDAGDGVVPSLAGRVASAAFAAVVDRCLHRDPEQRYASGDELREALEQVRPAAPRGQLPDGNPYRGLLPFEAEHRALFFGRGPDIRAVLERLRAEPFVLVTGDSGAGKSSLCRAGVLPELAETGLWRSVQLVPGRRPLEALARAIASELGGDEAALLAGMREQPAWLARELRRGSRQGVLVFVDQLEELCTIAERDEAGAFAAVLAELIATPGSRVLATVRSDFLARVAELPKLGTEIGRAMYLLRPLSRDGAREAVLGPARAKGAQFESGELVETLVTSGADVALELPLLAFTLAQLWDARDLQTQTISKASLDAIGGVRGALARHADGVLASMLPDQRRQARKLLLRFVTAERTRMRRTADELASFDPAVLDALVRGRLVVARGSEEQPMFELAHERLVDGWPALAGWLAESGEAIAAHTRLAAAVTDWERLGRAKDGLWGARQLADLDLVAGEDLAPAQLQFARASKRAVAKKRWLRRGVAIAIPVLVVGLYAGAKIVSSRDLDRRIAVKADQARQHSSSARAIAAEVSRLRADAFARFDAGDRAAGETAWGHARKRGAEAEAAYARAASDLEATFFLDIDRDDLRRELAELALERLELAEREHRSSEVAELERRLALYDTTGAVSARRRAPASLGIAIEPPTATISLVDAAGRATAHAAPLAPGVYTLSATAPGRAGVTMPIRLAPDERAEVAFALPRAEAVPAGFLYIPAGRFLSGSREDETVRGFFDNVPMHERRTDAFLIGRTEVTYAQWIEFLDALPEAERRRRTPRMANAGTVQEGNQVELRRVDGAWQLELNPAGTIFYKARAGEPIVYRDRPGRREQDWLQLPISGISAEDAEAYAAWLDRSGRLPRARLCNELEWERAARGIDGRTYPHGETLAADDANFDETYGRRDGGFGPDVVGTHPRSTSPYGLVDTSGNVWEIMQTATRDGYVMRGGGYYTGTITAHLANRQQIPIAFQHLHVGVRICADP
jgi:formylglycine-generating enzyme required for sulfatase activity